MLRMTFCSPQVLQVQVWIPEIKALSPSMKSFHYHQTFCVELTDSPKVIQIVQPPDATSQVWLPRALEASGSVLTHMLSAALRSVLTPTHPHNMSCSAAPHTVDSWVLNWTFPC